MNTENIEEALWIILNARQCRNGLEKEIKLKINGMMCAGCENRVKSAVSLIEGVEKVDADHNTGIVTVTSKEDLDISKIKEKIIDIGYEIEE